MSSVISHAYIKLLVWVFLFGLFSFLVLLLCFGVALFYFLLRINTKLTAICSFLIFISGFGTTSAFLWGWFGLVFFPSFPRFLRAYGKSTLTAHRSPLPALKILGCELSGAADLKTALFLFLCLRLSLAFVRVFLYMLVFPTAVAQKSVCTFSAFSEIPCLKRYSFMLFTWANTHYKCRAFASLQPLLLPLSGCSPAS